MGWGANTVSVNMVITQCDSFEPIKRGLLQNFFKKNMAKKKASPERI